MPSPRVPVGAPIDIPETGEIDGDRHTPSVSTPIEVLAIARNHGQWVGCHCQEVLRATASLRACMNFKLAEYGLDFDDSSMNR